jgi:hypothetical protein
MHSNCMDWGHCTLQPIAAVSQLRVRIIAANFELLRRSAESYTHFL